MSLRRVRIIAALLAFCLAAMVFLTALIAVLWPLEFDRRVEWVQVKIEALLPQAPHPEFVPTPLEIAAYATVPPVLTPTSDPLTAVTPTSTTAAKLPVVPPPTTTRRPTTAPTPAAALPPRVALTNFRHDYQRFNNCGPETLSILLSHYGRNETQMDLAAILKGSKDDRNVSPDELAALARSYGFKMIVRVNGTQSDLKAFLAQGIPVMIENWFVPRVKDASGHYRLLTGYDDGAPASTKGVGLSVEFGGGYPETENGYFIAQDSYTGPNIKLPYRAWDLDWRIFNRTYLVLYRDAQAGIVNSIIGNDVNDATMYAGALAVAQRELAANNKDGYGWFNRGSSLAGLGDWAQAAEAFDRARQLQLPWRMMWYQFGPYEAYLQTKRYAEVVALADATLVNYPNSEEALYYRGRAQMLLGQNDKARASFQLALQANARFAPAKQALEGLK